MNISDEAVEAAAKVNYSGEFYCAWDDLHSRVQDSWRRRARAALEAAAPHLRSDLEVFARMFEGFVVNLRDNNSDNDPVLVGEINAYTFAARQLRAAINDRSQG